MSYFSVRPAQAARNLVAYRLVFGGASERLDDVTAEGLLGAMRDAGHDVDVEWVRARLLAWHRRGMLAVEDGRLVVVR